MKKQFTTVLKQKGKNCFKCPYCTAIFEILAMDNATELNFCPNCGRRHNGKMFDIFNI